MKTTVFVYGTLQKGQGNHHIIEEGDSEFVGYAVTKDRYYMFSFGAFPAISETIPDHIQNASCNKASKIGGEVYEVDKRTLDRLDMLEGDGDFYKKEIRKVVMVDSNKIIDAYIYLIYDMNSFDDREFCSKRGIKTVAGVSVFKR